MVNVITSWLYGILVKHINKSQFDTQIVQPKDCKFGTDMLKCGADYH